MVRCTHRKKLLVDLNNKQKKTILIFRWLCVAIQMISIDGPMSLAIHNGPIRICCRSSRKWKRTKEILLLVEKFSKQKKNSKFGVKIFSYFRNLRQIPRYRWSFKYRSKSFRTVVRGMDGSGQRNGIQG